MPVRELTYAEWTRRAVRVAQEASVAVTDVSVGADADVGVVCIRSDTPAARGAQASDRYLQTVLLSPDEAQALVEVLQRALQGLENRRE